MGKEFESDVQKQLNKQEKRIESLENDKHSPKNNEKDHSNDKNKGTTLSGNMRRAASTVLAFMLLGPVGGMIVGALALADNKSKGKFSEAGKDLASGTGNILESLFKGVKSLVEKLLPHGKEQEVGMGNAKKSEQDREPNRLTDAEGLSAKVKDQAKELGKELTKATTNDQTSQSRVNDISQQRGMGR